MIAKLRGLVDTIGEDYCIVDVNGVGYLVFASSRTLSRLEKGITVSLFIETIVREDSITLYGFLDPLEREWFITLTKVQGVGARVCLNILSALSPNQIAQGISAGDKASFTRANGVGPKLAARIVTELKDKIVTVPIADAVLDSQLGVMEEVAGDAAPIETPSNDSAFMDDAISALVNLGYQRIEAYRAVNNVLSDNPDATVSDLIKLALKEFIKKDF